MYPAAAGPEAGADQERSIPAALAAAAGRRGRLRHERGHRMAGRRRRPRRSGPRDRSRSGRDRLPAPCRSGRPTTRWSRSRVGSDSGIDRVPRSRSPYLGHDGAARPAGGRTPLQDEEAEPPPPPPGRPPWLPVPARRLSRSWIRTVIVCWKPSEKASNRAQRSTTTSALTSKSIPQGPPRSTPPRSSGPKGPWPPGGPGPPAPRTRRCPRRSGSPDSPSAFGGKLPRRAVAEGARESMEQLLRRAPGPEARLPWRFPFSSDGPYPFAHGPVEAGSRVSGASRSSKRLPSIGSPGNRA